MPEMRTLRQWAAEDGLAYQTVVVRRRQAGVGTRIPPGTWLLTRAEWNIVKRTPLPGCTKIPA